MKLKIQSKQPREGMEGVEGVMGVMGVMKVGVMEGEEDLMAEAEVMVVSKNILCNNQLTLFSDSIEVEDQESPTPRRGGGG